MNVSISITCDNGVEVRYTEHDEPGCYIGNDAPYFLQGQPNVFIGKTFTAARKAAIEQLSDIMCSAEDAIDSVEFLRVKHIQAAR